MTQKSHFGPREVYMESRILRPEHLFIGVLLVLKFSGLTLQFGGLAPRVGFWIVVGAGGLAWLPALLAIGLMVLPRWW
jgi:hypothetical protein